MPFSDEILEKFAGKKAYSFTDLFSRYHQIRRNKIIKKRPLLWNGAPMLMPFGLKKAPSVFERVLVVAF